MIKNMAELRKILNFAKKSGVKSFKVGDIAVTFHDKDPVQTDSVLSGFQTNQPKATEDPGYASGERPPSDDEMMYASTDYFDVLRAQREAATQPPSTKEGI